MILAKPVNETRHYYINGADKYNEVSWQKHIAYAIEQRTKAIEYERNRVPVYPPCIFPYCPTTERLAMT